MSRKKPIPVYSHDEIPHFATDAEWAAFWETHEATEELLHEQELERERLGLPTRGRLELHQMPVEPRP